MDFPIKINPNTFVTPSIKDSLNSQVADIKKLGEATWAQAQKTYIQIKNQATNQVPVSMEQVNIMLKNVGDKADEYVNTKVDDIIYEKSGYHLSELNSMLSFGNQLWTAISTMYSTGTVPQPEWIVTMANTLKQMDKSNNPMIDEVVSQINTYWSKYNKIINKGFSFLESKLEKDNKETEDENENQDTKILILNNQGTLNIVSENPISGIENNTPVYQDGNNSQTIKEAENEVNYSIVQFMEKIGSLRSKDDSKKRFEENELIQQSRWKDEGWNKFIDFLYEGINLLNSFNCANIFAAISEYKKRNNTIIIKNYESIANFSEEWSKMFSLFVHKIWIGENKVQSWKFYINEETERLYFNVQIKSQKNAEQTEEVKNKIRENDNTIVGAEENPIELENVIVTGVAGNKSNNKLLQSIIDAVNNNPELKNLVMMPQPTKSQNNQMIQIIYNWLDANPELKNQINDFINKNKQENNTEENAEENAVTPEEQKTWIQDALNEVKGTFNTTVDNIKNAGIGVYNNWLKSSEQNFKDIGKNIISDTSTQWSIANNTIQNSVQNAKDIKNRIVEDASTYYNIFKNPAEAKKWLNKMLEAWLSSQSELLNNVFMINKFKDIISNIKKIADEGFKKDVDSFTKIESAMSMFDEVKEMIYNIKKIPVADNYNDIIDVDTSKIESFAKTAENTVKNTYDNIRSSVLNTVDSIENQVQEYKDYIDNTVNTFTSLGNNLVADILDVKEYFEKFEISNVEWIEDTARSMIDSLKDTFGDLNFEEFKNTIDFNKLKNNIKVSLKKKVADELADKNPEYEDQLKSLAEDENVNINITAFSYSVDLSIDIKEVLNSVIQDNILTAISDFVATKDILTNHINEEISNIGEELTNSISKLTSTLTEASDTLTNSETMLNNTLSDLNNNLTAISGSLLRGSNNILSVAEEAFNIDDLMPTAKVKAPPFMNYILSAIDMLAPAFKILERLVSNYKTNKQMTRNAALLKLSKIQSLQKFKEGFDLINDIKDIIEVKDENEAGYIRDEIINDKESVKSTVDEYGFILTEKGIKKYNQYRKFNKQNPLDENYDGLIMLNEDNRFKTDKNTHTNEVYIKDGDNSLPESASEILDNNIGNNCDEDFGLDPEYTDEGYIDDIITDDMMYPERYDGWETGSEEIDLDSLDLSNPEDLEIFNEFQSMNAEEAEMKKIRLIKDLRKTIQYETDEFEGLQNLLVDNINLCENPVSFYNDRLPKPGYSAIIGEGIDKIKNNPVIIEFARETLFGEGIDFNILVSPGENITENHNIALIYKNEKQKRIKSIFSSGTVRKDQYGDYAHINGCTRSIIIDNPEYSIGKDITAEIQEIQKEMEEEGELYDLITQNLIYSSYPQILMNSESPEETKQKMLSGSGNMSMLDTGETIYNKLIKHFESTEENFYEDILGKKKITKADAKENLGKKFTESIKNVKGNSQKIQEIANEHLEKRRKYILGDHSWENKKDGIIDLYENYTTDNILYSKCRILSDDGKDIRDNLDLTYYIDLYSRLDIENNSGEWYKEYRDILKDIMNYRRSCRHDNYQDLIKLLNDKAFNSNDYKLTDIPDNNLWEYLETKFTICPNYNDFYYALKEKIKDKEDTPDNFLNILYNIYEYIKHNDPKFIESIKIENSISDINNLLFNENNKLKDFWEKAIKRYKDIEFDKQKEKLSPDEIQEAIWPDKMTITLNRREYDLYLFKNLFTEEDIILPDEDINADILNAEVDLDNYIADTSTAAQDFYDVDFEQKKTTIDYTDIKYWMRWCSIATLSNCCMGSNAWSTGMVINGYFVQFPCVLIPMKVINIKIAKVSIIIGLSIRLLTVQPMVIYVNQYNEVNNINVLLTSMLEKVKEKYSKYIKYLENVNLNAIQIIINRLENSNTSMLNENKQLEIVLQDLKAFLPTNWADAQKEIADILGEPPVFQNIYRIKNYPKLSDFNTNLHMKIGSNSIFAGGEYNIDFSKFDPSQSIEDNISNITGMQAESDKMKTSAAETKANEEKTEEQPQEQNILDIVQEATNNIFNNPNNIPGYIDYSKGIPSD